MVCIDIGIGLGVDIGRFCIRKKYLSIFEMCNFYIANGKPKTPPQETLRHLKDCPEKNCEKNNGLNNLCLLI